MTESRVHHVASVPVQSGVPAEWSNPIRPERFVGKHQQRLGKAAALTQFGVNRVTLEPGAWSALRHTHSGQEEFVYVVEGELVLVDDAGEQAMPADSFAGFLAGDGNAHHFVNHSGRPATFLVVGTRQPDDVVHYPDDAL